MTHMWSTVQLLYVLSFLSAYTMGKGQGGALFSLAFIGTIITMLCALIKDDDI